jgi:peptide/nickel transport system substrate-binding protein
MTLARALKLLCVLLAATVSAPASAQPKDELVIGITQFPSTFHPLFDPMWTKTYILGMAQRPLVTYDKDWKLVCMLCTELPTIENGRLKPVDLPDGKKGAEITYTIRADAKWGNGQPVTSADVVFAWEVGRHPDVGAVSGEYYRRATKIDVRRQAVLQRCVGLCVRSAAVASRQARLRDTEGLSEAQRLRHRHDQSRPL